MSVFTTMKIKKETKEKLDLIKGSSVMSYNDIIETLLARIDGGINEEILNVEREPVAFILEYVEHGNPSSIQELPVTYKDLAKSPIGTVFCPFHPSLLKDCSYATSKIVYREGDNVIIKNTVYEYDSKSECVEESRFVKITVF